jgi:hypothetical protein
MHTVFYGMVSDGTGLGAGRRALIMGNSADLENDTTPCPCCGEPVVFDGYSWYCTECEFHCVEGDI